MRCNACGAELLGGACPGCGPQTVRLGDEELAETLPVLGKVPRQLGDFRIERELGRGGMGVVFEAIQRSLDRRVALKVLPSADVQSDEQVELMRREATSIARLGHPNVVEVYTFGAEPGWTFFAMELVEGQNLEQRLAEGPLSLEEVLEIALQIAGALECAHEAGVLHRDLKPGNVLVEPDGRVQVADFGLAKWTFEGGGYDDGVILGTPEYMSPEQASGRPLGPATDVYSFGVLLYRMLAGRVPFAGDDPLEVLTLHQLEPPVDLRQVATRVPFELGELVMRCLAKKEAARYAGAGALREALRAFRVEYLDLRAFMKRDGQDTEAIVLDALGAGGETRQPMTAGLRYVEATVLVADLENFLRLAVTLRPANVTRLLERFYHLLRTTIEAHHGTVVELFGDTVLATFGDPIPVDDHTAVALDAALELRRVLNDLSRDLQPPVSVRIGVETGLLLAGFVDDGRQRRYHAYGDAVVIAHALERLAAGRSDLLIGAAAWQATREAFAFEDVEPLEVRLRGRRRGVQPRRVLRRLP